MLHEVWKLEIGNWEQMIGALGMAGVSPTSPLRVAMPRAPGLTLATPAGPRSAPWGAGDLEVKRCLVPYVDSSDGRLGPLFGV